MSRRTLQTFIDRPLRLLTVALALAASLAVGTAILTAPSHALAQPYDDGKPGYGSGDPDYADADLNRDIAARNDAEEDRDSANDRAYSDAQRRYAEAVNQRLNDEVRAEAEYNRRVAEWRSAVARCNAGDYSYCDNDQPQR
jgi:hypothetical protein